MNKTTKQLLEENNQREKELSPDNQKVLTDIVAYLRGSSTPILQQEQVRRDITEMLLEGEVRGQSAQTIIGTDYQAFCDEILAELPRRSARQRTIYGLSVVSLSAAVLVSSGWDSVCSPLSFRGHSPCGCLSSWDSCWGAPSSLPFPMVLWSTSAALHLRTGVPPRCR